MKSAGNKLSAVRPQEYAVRVQAILCKGLKIADSYWHIYCLRASFFLARMVCFFMNCFLDRALSKKHDIPRDIQFLN
jgi:hypothetical protein